MNNKLKNWVLGSDPQIGSTDQFKQVNAGAALTGFEK